MPKRKLLRSVNPKKQSKSVSYESGRHNESKVVNVNDDDEEDDDEDDEDNEDDDICMEGNVEDDPIPITFEFKDMKESCQNGLSNLLNKLFYQKDVYDVACIISQQIAVGTTISCEDGDDIFAYSTILPLTYLQSCVKFTHILQDCLKVIKNSHNVSENIKNLFVQYLSFPAIHTDSNSSSTTTHLCHPNTGKCGILLHNRFANLPLPLIGALHKNLMTDLDWTKQQEEEEAIDSSQQTTDRTFSSLKMMCLISKCTLSNTTSSTSNGKGSKGSGNITSSTHDTTVQDVTGCSSLLFDLFEDEVYAQHAEGILYLRQVYSLQGPITLALIPVSAYPAIMSSISKMLPSS